MSGMATHWTVSFDAADPQRLAAFWAFALGYADEPGRAKVAELVGAGATAVREEHDGDQLSHIEMRDPEGNEFCVAWGPDRP